MAYEPNNKPQNLKESKLLPALPLPSCAEVAPCRPCLCCAWTRTFVANMTLGSLKKKTTFALLIIHCYRRRRKGRWWWPPGLLESCVAEADPRLDRSMPTDCRRWCHTADDRVRRPAAGRRFLPRARAWRLPAAWPWLLSRGGWWARWLALLGS